MDPNKYLKAQGATEYIVLLAIVLIIVLVVVGLLGFFPSFSSDTQASESQSYWGSTRPMALIGSSQNTAGGIDQNVSLVVENHASQVITITRIFLNASNGSTASNATGWTLAPGERIAPIVMNNSGTNQLLDCTGRSGKSNSYNVTFVYNDESLTGKRQVGSKALIVTCGT